MTDRFAGIAGIFLLLAIVPVSRAGVVSVCPNGCDFSSIQAAIAAVDPGDTIQLLMTAPHTEADILVNKDVVIVGVQQQQTVVQAAAVTNSNMGRVMTILSGNTVTLRDFSIRYGDAPFGGGGGLWVQSSSNGAAVTLERVSVELSSASYGGGILNEGELALIDSTVTINTATLNSGGGIDNRGTLMMTGGSVTLNSANSSGGGIFSGADEGTPQVVLDAVSVSRNQANRGGGIFNRGEFSISAGSVVSGNIAIQTGAGIHHASPNFAMQIDGAIVDRNELSQGAGGGVFAAGPMTITHTTISNHGELDGDSPNFGGGLYIEGASVSLLQVNLERNAAQHGGGIYNAAGTLSISQSALWVNSVNTDGGGYSQMDGSSDFTNVTVAGNFADGSGGGMMLCGGRFAAANITVTDNAAGGAVSTSDGGGIVFRECSGLSTDLRSSIVAGNVTDQGSYPDCQGSFRGRFSLIGNIGIGPGCSADGFTSGMIYNTSSGLDTLVNGAGSARGYPLLAGSVAIDSGLCVDSSGALLAVDQQGAPLPVDGDMDNDPKCDMGSLEFGSVVPRPDPVFSNGFEN